MTQRWNHYYCLPRPVPQEGRHAIVTFAGRDAVDASGATDERAALRTAKPCGSGAPLQASSSRRRESVARMTGSKKAIGPRGERGISRKTIAWGMPDVPGASAVNTHAHIPLPHSAHEAAGALGTRHPPRPLIGEGGIEFKTRAFSAARSRTLVDETRHSINH